MFYSPSSRGFYSREIHGNNIPSDSVEITVEERDALLAGERAGQRIVPGPDGYPVLQDRPGPTEEQIVARFEAALDKYLDAVAQGYRYADRTRLALRAAYPNQHQALASAFGTWMDNCNDIAKQLYVDVKEGRAPMPETVEHFLSLLPAFVAP